MGMFKLFLKAPGSREGQDTVVLRSLVQNLKEMIFIVKFPDPMPQFEG